MHRRVYLDYIGVKRFDADGKLIGEFRIVGLFTSTAYTRSARGIPYLRRKVAAVLERAPASIRTAIPARRWPTCWRHYPRDELFQIDEDTLYRFALAILQLDERPRVRVLARRDRFDRFVSVLVYRAARALRQRDPRPRSATIWRDVFNGRVVGLLSVLPGRAAGARAFHHRPLRRARRRRSDARDARSTRSRAIVRTWTDGLAEALALAHDAGRARASCSTRYRDAFSAGYPRRLFAGRRGRATSARSRR